METQVRTPQMVFMQPQRLVVPLFQRRYAWNEQNQWQPLWDDVSRLADRVLRQPQDRQYPHFLGAVVLQQVQNVMGTLQTRMIIDGQQRLTTLQLLFDALHAELSAAGAAMSAMRLEPLVVNASSFCRKPEDRFKVWPTNRDRAPFAAVMAADPPVNYESLGHAGERIIDAHRFFSNQARNWIAADGPTAIDARSNAIEFTVRELLQMVVIDLGQEENAQEIFETLNARGSQLTAADLIKNFIFQRLSESSDGVENAYVKYWHDFESAFWEAETSVGRLRYPRSAIFLNHWLIARTSELVVASEVFTRFKRYTVDAQVPMIQLLAEVAKASHVYRDFVEAAQHSRAVSNRMGLFAYRTSTLESEVIKPLVLYLLDPERPEIPNEQLTKAVAALESWMVRRMLVRATTNGYNRLITELIVFLGSQNRVMTGDAVESFLLSQTADSSYWPDDEEIRNELRMLPAYRRLGRGRLRMVLEAIEDHLRGWRDDRVGLGGERVVRGKYAIEHIMPRKWQMHWPLVDGTHTEVERDALIHTIGNLTLLTTQLNSKVSNGPWLGDTGKRHGLQGHDVLMLNRNLIRSAGDNWTDSAIKQRSDDLAKIIVDIWPAPPGHRTGFAREKVAPRHKVDLSDLLSAGRIQAGAIFIPRRRKFATSVATLLPDGRLDVGGKIFANPSEAARIISGANANGWAFFLVDVETKRSLKDVRLDYLESLAVESDEDDAVDDLDDEN